MSEITNKENNSEEYYFDNIEFDNDLTEEKENIIPGIIIEQVKSLGELAHLNIFREAEGIIGENNNLYKIMIRWSLPIWDGYKTLDVVQISNLQLLYTYDITEFNEILSKKPKRAAIPIWNALENYALENGRRLRIESILYDKIRQYLIKERNYMPRKYEDGSLIHHPL